MQESTLLLQLHVTFKQVVTARTPQSFHSNGGGLGTQKPDCSLPANAVWASVVQPVRIPAQMGFFLEIPRNWRMVARAISRDEVQMRGYRRALCRSTRGNPAPPCARCTGFPEEYRARHRWFVNTGAIGQTACW
jgi:hypothetical protein